MCDTYIYIQYILIFVCDSIYLVLFSSIYCVYLFVMTIYVSLLLLLIIICHFDTLNSKICLLEFFPKMTQIYILLESLISKYILLIYIQEHQLALFALL